MLFSQNVSNTCCETAGVVLKRHSKTKVYKPQRKITVIIRQPLLPNLAAVNKVKERMYFFLNNNSNKPKRKGGNISKQETHLQIL